MLVASATMRWAAVARHLTLREGGPERLVEIGDEVVEILMAEGAVTDAALIYF